MRPFSSAFPAPLKWFLAVPVVGALLAPARAWPEPGRLAVDPVASTVEGVGGGADLHEPQVTIADLDLGLIAGSSRWDHDGDGVSWNDTYVGFLRDAAGVVHVFSVRERIYFNDNIQFLHDISPSQAVVGANLFRRLFRSLPFLWTPEHGYRFLPTPCSPRPRPRQPCSGTAAAVSANGRIVAGHVTSPPPAAVRAARWSVRRSGDPPRLALRLLSSPRAGSRAWDVSADGRVIVGETLSGELQPRAALWARGSPRRDLAVGEASTASFVAADGSAALGWSELEGRRVLVRWSRAGEATIATPPEGYDLASLRAVNPTATAAVGALSRDGNWAPFVWTSRRGFTVIEELGREEDYDRSEALDVSDGGRAVVGVLQSSFVNEGDPPSLAFVWTAASGLTTLNDLVAGAGVEDVDLYHAVAISGEARQLLATGDPARAPGDTSSLLITLARPLDRARRR